MAAPWLRPTAWACAVFLLLAGCTYSADEPGLFSSPRPSVERSGPPPERFRPKPTNPELPVLGERLWAIGPTESPTVFRYAVHAVRRVEGATVLDWSVTPVRSPGLAFGDTLPSVDLGLEVGTRLAVTLVDPAARKVYQPLMHRSREEFNHCLCVPLLRLRLDFRIGETRLLQIAFPALPESADFVDVSLNTVAPVRHVPVSPVGTAPVARRPTDLARPAQLPPPPGPTLAPGEQLLAFANPGGTEQYQEIRITRVLAAPGRTTLEWTLTTLDAQRTRVLDYGPPVERAEMSDVEVVGSSQASGPALRVGSQRLTNLFSQAKVFTRTAYECQCTEIGLWASGLRDAGHTVTLVTSFPGLPAGTRTVDVEFSDNLTTLHRLPVTADQDAARNAGPSRPVETGTWTYEVKDPPYGWPTSEWPTDLPDLGGLAEYEQYVEPLVTLPDP